MNSRSPALLASILAVGIAIAAGCPGAMAQEKAAGKHPDLNLVQVRITTVTPAPKEPGPETGGTIPYRPTIEAVFPSTGFPVDDKGHVVTFLGYSWIYIYKQNPTIEIIDQRGARHPARLVGIDQTVRIAVVRSQGAGLRKALLCESCVVKGGDTVLVPIVQGSSAAQLESAQIRSVSNRTGPVGATGWAVSLDRPLNVLGAPLLNARNEILGIVEDQPSVDMSADQKISMTVLSISRVLRSADRIIKTGGDIQSGWLGVMVDSEAESKGGVAISGVEIDGPAHKAGVLPGDIITRWNGKGIHDYDQLIEIIQNTPIGAKATIGVSRNGQPVQLTAVIEARRPVDPYEMTMSSIASLAAGPSGGARGAPIEAVLGIYVLPLTPELAEILKMRAQGGLFVYSVTPQSAFESAGIAVGDVIIDIDGVRVDSPQTFSDQLRMKAAAGRFALRILRRGSEITRSVVLPGFPRKRSN